MGFVHIVGRVRSGGKVEFGSIRATPAARSARFEAGGQATLLASIRDEAPSGAALAW
jgi:hypothetical protein